MSKTLLDCSLPAEEFEGHGGEEHWDALLMMQMKSHHLSKSFGKLCLHELHTSVGALHTHTPTQASKDNTQYQT